MRQLYLSKEYPNIGDIPQQTIEKHLNNYHKKCQKCSHKILYKCMEYGCRDQNLICPKCQVYCLDGNHYNHSFSYILPLFKNYQQFGLTPIAMKLAVYIEKLEKLRKDLQTSMQKITKKIDKISEKSMDLQQFLLAHKLGQFTKRVQNIEKYSDLNELFMGVSFPCSRDYHKLYKQIISPDNFNHKDTISVHNQLEHLQNKINSSINEALLPPQIQLNNDIPQPYFLLNRNVVSFITDKSQFNNILHLYTDQLRFSKITLHVQKFEKQTDLIDFFALTSKCNNLTINHSLTSQLYNQTAYPLMDNCQIQELSVRGNNRFINKIVRAFCRSGQIKAVNLRCDTLFDDNLMKIITRSESIDINCIKNNLDPAPNQHIIRALSNPNVKSFKLTYAGLFTKWSWLPQTLQDLQKSLQFACKRLLIFKTNGIKWQDPETFSILQKCSRLIQMQIPIYQSQNQSIFASNNQRTQLFMKKLQLRKRSVYTLANLYRHKKYLKNVQAHTLDKIVVQFILDI